MIPTGGNEEHVDLPGVELAYGFVQGSYEWAVGRHNAVEGRIQALMAFSASFVLAAPLLISASSANLTLSSPWFYSSVVLAILNLIVGTSARVMGNIQLLGVNRVREEWLELSDYQFKVEAIRWAAIHFEKNTRIINAKGWTATLLALGLLAEITVLTYWGLVQIT